MKTPTLLRHVALMTVACLFCVLNTGCLIDWAIGEKKQNETQTDTQTDTPKVTPDQQHPNCPDGRCPNGDLPTGDLPVGSTALISTGDCVPCAQVSRPVAYRQPAIQQPASPLDAKLFVGTHEKIHKSPKDELKTGSYTCRRCGRSTVGDQWHELRTANGDSMLLMCQPCYDKTNDAERRQVLESLLRSAGHYDTAIASRLRDAL